MKLNYNYGKIDNGKLVYAPNKIRETMLTPTGAEVEVSVFNGTAEQYLSVGYKAIIKDNCPQDGKTYEEELEETETTIYIHYREIDPPTPVPTEADRLDAAEAAIIDLAEIIGGILNG